MFTLAIHAYSHTHIEEGCCFWAFTIILFVKSDALSISSSHMNFGKSRSVIVFDFAAWFWKRSGYVTGNDLRNVGLIFTVNIIGSLRILLTEWKGDLWWAAIRSELANAKHSFIPSPIVFCLLDAKLLVFTSKCSSFIKITAVHCLCWSTKKCKSSGDACWFHC